MTGMIYGRADDTNGIPVSLTVVIEASHTQRKYIHATIAQIKSKILNIIYFLQSEYKGVLKRVLFLIRFQEQKKINFISL